MPNWTGSLQIHSYYEMVSQRPKHSLSMPVQSFPIITSFVNKMGEFLISNSAVMSKQQADRLQYVSEKSVWNCVHKILHVTLLSVKEQFTHQATSINRITEKQTFLCVCVCVCMDLHIHIGTCLAVDLYVSVHTCVCV